MAEAPPFGGRSRSLNDSPASLDSVRGPAFYTSDEQDTRCVQACYQMLVARTTPFRISLKDAEAATGYAPGMLTWQFQMLHGLASRYGLHVLNYDLLDLARFIRAPQEAISAWAGDPTAAQHQMNFTDIPREVQWASRCGENERINFVCGAPSYADLRYLVGQGCVVSCVIDGASIVGSPGYRPHSVVVNNVGPNWIELSDPGPRARANWRLSERDFVVMWTSPSPTLRNLIACSTSPIQLPA